jgi:hypothetical protein
MNTLKDLQRALQEEVTAAKVARLTMLTAIGAGTQLMAQKMIGHYQADWQPSPFGPMGQLSPETLRIKRSLNQGMDGNPDTPLYATGKYKASIEYIVTSVSTVEIGSNDEKAKWLEYGTAKMVPRPIFKKALMLTLPVLNKLIPEIYFRNFK